MTRRRVAVVKQTMMAPSTGSRLANNKNDNFIANSGCCFQHAAVSGRAVTGCEPTAKCANPFLRQRRNFNTSTCLLASSSTSLSSSSTSIDDTSWEQTRNNQFQISRVQPRIDEPNLFDIPSNLSPTYGHVPFLLQAAIVLLSALIVERRSLSRLLGILRTTTAPFSYLLSQIAQRPLTQRLFNASIIRQLVAFILRTTLLSTLATLAIQERFFPPSRVTTAYLATRGELPSTLSEYSMVLPVAVPPLLPFINNNNGGKAVTTASSSWNDDALTPPPVPIGVHSIQYTQSPPSTSTITAKYDDIYLHHGFGASSLSWLPILPTLVDRLGNGKARGIAHDAPGFGFTDRPDGDVSGGLQQYGTENNVSIGLALLKESLMDVDSMSSGVGGSGGGGSSAVEADETKSIAIFGHSMGCKAALLMALHCHVHKQFQLRPRLVVLVAPALEGVSLPSNNGNGNKKKLSTSRTHGVSKGWLSKVWHRIWVTSRKLFLDYPFQYGLRRLVCGTKDFWRKGLALAWGDRHRLSDSDVLRFQWPSIGSGWERGLITFARSRLASTSISHPALDDGQLLREVSKLDNTTVVIVYGSNDTVVRIEGDVARRLKKEFPTVRFVRMEGLGHDPFEEDVPGFITELEKAIEN